MDMNFASPSKNGDENEKLEWQLQSFLRHTKTQKLEWQLQSSFCVTRKRENK